MQELHAERTGDIDPDIPPQVWTLTIEGNETFSDMVLKNQIATEAPSLWKKIKFWNKDGNALSENELRKDVVRLQNYYNRRGFGQVEVDYEIIDDSKEWKKHVVITIEENDPVRIRQVNYNFETSEEQKEHIRGSGEYEQVQRDHGYRVGHRYESIKEPEVVGSISDVLKNLGYAHANVSVDTGVDSSQNEASVDINIESGPRTYFENIEVSGVETVSKDFIIRESGIEKGEPYSFEKLEDAQQEIFNHHLFRFITISVPDQPQDSTLDVQMRVREYPLRSVETSIGLGIEEYARGEVGWQHRSAFGRGHNFSARGHASYIEQSLDFDYTFPYIRNTKSSIVVSPFAQHLLEPSFELFRAGVTNSFIYRYDQNMTGSVSYQYTKNQELSQQSDASLPDSTISYDLSSLQLSGYYRQDQARDPKGWVVQPFFEVSGFFGAATHSFQKMSLDVRRYSDLTETTTLATRVQGGSLFNVNSDSLPGNERFYLGGTNSVRGWSRQDLGPKQSQIRVISTEQPDGSLQQETDLVEYVPTGGRSMFSFNLELRQDLDALINGVGISTFLDGGQVWNEVNDIGTRPIQFGLGGGLSYNSPIGPVRVDVGYKLNPTDEDLNIYEGENFGSNWDKIGIHFSIGQAF